jgi:putative transcriptional regulator
MEQVRSRFQVLLAEKGMREGRTISLREVHRQTGVAMTALSGLTTNTARAINFDVLLKICQYLECQPGDLLVVQEVSEENSGPVYLKAA